MKTKLSILALVALAAVPFAAQAQPGADAAVDACVKSFVDTYLPGHPIKQVSKQEPAPGPIDTYYAPRQYTIALAAYNARSGDLLAQARCVANRKGTVIVLDSPPAGEYVARANYTVSLR
jgi:hypothetical protein